MPGSLVSHGLQLGKEKKKKKEQKGKVVCGKHCITASFRHTVLSVLEYSSWRDPRPDTG